MKTIRFAFVSSIVVFIASFTMSAQDKILTNHPNITYSWGSGEISVYNEYDISVYVHYSGYWVDDHGKRQQFDKNPLIRARTYSMLVTGYESSAPSVTILAVTDTKGKPI